MSANPDTAVRIAPACIGLLTLVACVMIAGCKADPQKKEARLKQLEPAALAAAQERGRLDLNCEQVKSTVLSVETAADQNIYSLFRPEYRVATQGCGKRTVFTVACTDEGYCTAMAQNSAIEPAK